MSSPTTTPPLRLVSLPGRGRSYVTTRTILPGEILLSDRPILLYPPSPTTSHCSLCFRTLTSSPSSYKCPSCSSPFCSPSCLSSSSHSSSFLCRSLSLLLPSSAHLLSSELLFLLSAFSLSPPSFSLLLSLSPSPSPPPPSHHLHSLLSSLHPPFSVDLNLTSTLLSIDRANSFGLMDGRGSVRAYGIYPSASFFNHDCLPNASRFEYVDSGSPANTEMFVRAIHEIGEGREICLSYFPVNWQFRDRQTRLWEEYGFRCVCDRCEVEKNWKEDVVEDDGMEKMDDDDDARDDEEGEEEEEGEVDDFPHAYFFVKFQCRREGCGGTLAPLPPSTEGVLSDRMECNACGSFAKVEEGDGEESSSMLDD